MNLKAPLTAAVLSLAVLTACNQGGGDGNNVGDAASTPATTSPDANAAGNDPAAAPGEIGAGGMGAGADATGATPGSATAGATAMTEADAVGMLVAINEHEIAAAEQARSKNVKGRVLEYANMMHKEHTQNLQQTRALEGSAGVTAGTGGDVAAQRTKSEAKRTQLASLSGDAYERAYIDAMVQDHQEALTMLDQRLIPAAQNAALRQHLTMTRDAVARHLEQARALQGGAAGSTSGQAGQTGQTPPAG
ncbi:MAG TPA: DUF4142 domain-containing protein [Lysobacter sp.]